MSKPGVSVVCWVNDQERFYRDLIPTMMPGYQMADYNLQVLMVPPTALCKNMGQAYNRAQPWCKYENRVYVHQDVYMHDRYFMGRLFEMLALDNVGVVGVIGSDIDTGAAFFHSPIPHHIGRRNGFFLPTAGQVKVIDGLLMATRADFAFSEDYEGSHMVIEDYCMKVRATGKEVWLIDSLVTHLSGGTLDDAYWRSAAAFKRKWRRSLPDELPSLRYYRSAGVPVDTYTMEIDIDVVP